MVIDGSIVLKPDFAVAELEGERISLPIRFVKQAQLNGHEPIECFLLVVTAGRYRLLTETSPDIDNVIAQMEEVGRPGQVLDGTETNIRPSIRARLIPCVITPPRPGWRMNVPKVAIQLAPGERSHVFLLIVAGYVELWFPDTLRQAVAGPISDLLS